MKFAQVVGQQRTKEGIRTMVQTGRLPHALLFTGSEGAGTLPLALAVAQYIFCQQPGEDACGVCPSCIKMKTLEHPDLIMSFPTIAPKPGAKPGSHHFIQEFREFVAQSPYASDFDWLQFIQAENKQGNITAQECREIIEKLSLKSYEGGKKVLVMWQAEYLGKEGNILLKLIEEPPADTIIIMTTNDVEAMLPTIISRMQMVRLQPLLPNEIADALMSRNNISERNARECAQLSGGSYARAVQLMQHQEDEIFPEIRNWFNYLFTNNGVGISEFVEQMAKKGREQQKNILALTARLLQHTLEQKYQPKLSGAGGLEEETFVAKLVALNISFETIIQWIKEINATAYHIERNAHSKSQLHALCIKMKQSLVAPSA